LTATTFATMPLTIPMIEPLESRIAPAFAAQIDLADLD
jgi:hypothetical protein